MTSVENTTTTRSRGGASSQPRILYLTEFWPHRTTIGAELRSGHVLRALEQMGKVEVVVLDDQQTEIDAATKLSNATRNIQSANLTWRATRGLTHKVLRVFDSRPNFPHGHGVEKPAEESLLKRLNDFDLIWFFKWRTPNMFPYRQWPHSVVDIDDVPSTYERTALEKASGIKERFLARMRMKTWQRRERLLGERFNVLTVCSDGDRDYLKGLGANAPIHVIPNGYEKPNPEPVRRPASPPRIGFIGLFDYIANREGIHWFVNECWARVKREIPDARLRLVGQGSDGPHKPPGPDIEALGWLTNPSDEVATWSAMVVPIRMGAGTRVKIAYGFGQKCPTVSTSLGAYGYDVRNGNELLLADSAEAFASACVKLIREPAESAAMTERAWAKFLKHWTWEAISPRIWAAAEDGIRSGKSKT